VCIWRDLEIYVEFFEWLIMESCLGGFIMTFLEMTKLTLEKANVPLTVDEIWNKGFEYGFGKGESHYDEMVSKY
jgi:hypothetical protein